MYFFLSFFFFALVLFDQPGINFLLCLFIHAYLCLVLLILLQLQYFFIDYNKLFSLFYFNINS